MNKFFLVFLITLTLLIAGCVQQPQGNIAGCAKDAKICSDGTSVGRDATNNCEFFPCPIVAQPPVTPPQADFSFKTPTEGSSVDSIFTAEVVPVNFSIGTAGTANKTNEGHFHFFLDNGNYIPVIGQNYEFKNLKPGAHTLRATLNNNDHSPIGVEKSVSFIVATINPGFNAMIKSQTENSATIAIDAWNFEFGQTGAPNAEGKGHYHWFLDGGTYNVLTGNEFSVKNLSAGMHSIRITMNNNDHSEVKVNEATIEQTIDFEIVPKASFMIESPINNATVDSPVVIKLKTTNFAIGTGTANKANEGHFHYFIDNGSYNTLYAKELTLKGLKPGLHSVRFTANNNDHSEIASMGSQTAKFYIQTSKPGFEIKTPTISENSATITLEWWNFNIGKTGSIKTIGYGHFHYFVDGGEYKVLEGSSFTLPNLSTGTHTVRVVMENNDHTDYMVDGATVEHTINFTMP